MGTIKYNGWELTLTNATTILITKDGESREYTVAPVVRKSTIEEYVFLYHKGGDFTQVNFEEDNFLVIDLFDKDGEFIDSLGWHVFGE